MTLVRDLLLQFAATEDALVIPRKTRATEQLTDWTSASALLSFATSFLNFVGGDDFTWDLEYFLFCRRVVYMQSCLHVRLLFFHRFFLKISCMKQIHHHLLQCLTALRAGIPCLAVFCMVACGRKYFGAAGVLCCVLENTIPCHPPVNCVWTVEILPEIFLLKQKNFWKVNSSLGCQGILNKETQILQKPKKHQGMEMPKLGSLSFSLEPFYFFFFAFEFWGMAAGFLSAVLLLTLHSVTQAPCSQALSEGPGHCLVTSELAASLETNSCQFDGIFFATIRKYPRFLFWK